MGIYHLHQHFWCFLSFPIVSCELTLLARKSAREWNNAAVNEEHIQECLLLLFLVTVF